MIIFRIMANTWKIFKQSVTEFLDDDCIKLSASLSYYTIFALGPMLIVIISFAGIFLGREAVEGKLYGQIKLLVGSAAAAQIQSIIANLQQSQQSVTAAIIGIILLILGATGVFTEIQGSINYIWAIRAKPKKGWLRFITNRLISFSLVISCGFILLVSLTINALIELLNEKLRYYFESVTIVVFYIVNWVMIFAIIATLFAIIFKVLPDATIKWKDAFIGASFTALLFMLGKFLISLYIGKSNVGLTYGAAGSIIVILVWVYYSSLILFFGAEFTKIYSIQHGAGIKPTDTAVFIIKREAKEIGESKI
ncbi:MAG TPA: YihY/virulence factor BrkB family protein [Niastella sp.]